MRPALLVTLLMLAACASSTPPVLPDDLGELERLWIRALIRSDRPMLKTLAANDFKTEMNEAGAPSENRVPSWVLGVPATPGSGNYDERAIEIGPINVIIDGDQAAVRTTLTYKPHVSLRLGEQNYGAQRTWSIEDRWQRRDGRWQVVRRIASPLLPNATP